MGPQMCPASQRPAAALSCVQSTGAKRPGGTIGGNFQVFEDSTDRDDNDEQRKWDTGTATQNSKENVGLATQWAGVTLPQKRERQLPPPRATAACPFEIFAEAGDGESDTGDKGVSDAQPPADRPSMRLQLDGGLSNAERMKRDRLQVNFHPPRPAQPHRRRSSEHWADC